MGYAGEKTLFEKYRSEVESKIAAIERKRLAYIPYQEDINQEDEPEPNKSTQENFLGKLKELIRGRVSPNNASFKGGENG